MGCGGGIEKPSPAANKDNVCDQIAQVACYDLYECCSEGQIESYLNVTDPRSHDDCVGDVTRLCNQKLGIVDASITAGRVSFDSAKMNTCLQALITPDTTCATVGTTLPWTAACMDTAWTGTVAVGGMCTYRFECANADTTFCAPNQTCTALPTDGMACAQPGCAPGFYCGGGTCHTEVPVGGACTGGQVCTKGNFCSTGTGGMRTCAPLASAGQACTGNQSCESSQCLPGTCSNTGNTCFQGSDCGGRCSNNNQQCQLNSDCGGRCSNNQQNCQTDANCGQGTCSIGGAQCQQANQCTGTGNTCVFPNTCVLNTCNTGTCMGDVVCAQSQVSADYCTGAVASLPTPP